VCLATNHMDVVSKDQKPFFVMVIIYPKIVAVAGTEHRLASTWTSSGNPQDLPIRPSIMTRPATEHLIQKRQRALRLEPSIIRLRNSGLHTRDVSRSIHGRASVVVAVRLDNAQQIGAVVVIDRPPQRGDLCEDLVLVGLEVFAVFDVLPDGGVVLKGVAGDV
jgi:hypothetical protein